MTPTGWRLLDEVSEFDAVAGEFLRADPVVHTVLLGLVTLFDSTPQSGPCLWAVYEEDGAVTAAAWRTPPFGVGITQTTPACARALVEVLSAARAAGRRGLDLMPAVLGPPPAAPALAHAVAAAWGVHVGHVVHETLYALAAHELVSPALPDGRARRAGADDVDLLTGWTKAFSVEAGLVPGNDSRDAVAGLVEAGRRWVWEDTAGSVVCMVGARATGAGVGRVGPVYTPTEHRGRGYAAALTAAVTSEWFDAGLSSMTLYADDANRTSTGIYLRLGYRPVMDWTEFHLVATAD